MSRQINQPSNQVPLTNVAIVRYTAAGKRFEIACYRNKILDYRAGLETDLSEVLQTDRIFTNVSKGQFASNADLIAAFGSTTTATTTTTTAGGSGGGGANNVDYAHICTIILERGKSLQVSDLERQQLTEQLIRQIAVWVSKHCVHPVTQRPYTVPQIQQALVHYNFHVDGALTAAASSSTSSSSSSHKKQQKNDLKKQYLQAVKFLKTVMPIERAKMELSLQYHKKDAVAVQQALEQLKISSASSQQYHRSSHVVAKNDDDADDSTETILLQVDPSLYRPLHDVVQQQWPTTARLEIVQQQVVSTEVVGEGGVIAMNDNNNNNVPPEPPTPDPAIVLNEYDEQDNETLALAEQLKTVRLQPTSAVAAAAPTTIRTNNNLTNASKKKKKKKNIKKTANHADTSDDSHDEDHKFRQDGNSVPHINKNDSDAGEVHDAVGGDVDDMDDMLVVQPTRRKNQRKAQKKKQKKAKQRQQQPNEEEQDDDDDNDNDNPQGVTAAEGGATVAATRTEPPTTTGNNNNSSDTSGSKSCTTCGGSFATASDYRAHFRSDWHRFNQKLKLKGIPAVSEREFELCDAETFFGSEKNKNK